jgi:HSP20 family protein
MLTRWEPFREVVSLRHALDRLFDESFVRPTPGMTPPGIIPLDIHEEDGNLFIKASMPGMKPEDIHIQVKDDALTIWGEVKQEEKREEETYHLREIRYGRFERSTMLPYPVQVDKAEAEYENGMLILKLPKGEAVRPKEIPVKTKELVPA